MNPESLPSENRERPSATQSEDKGNNAHQEPPPVKLWSSKDPFRYPLSKPDANDGDPWNKVLEKERKYDGDRCDVWKGEIDNILLFAALFSAIVTAFTLESSKRLEVDHQESTVTILLVMHQQLDSLVRQNATTLPSLIPDPASTFYAPSYAIHVNVCWYLSLILSLTTVVIGILCLQWLREHRREPTSSDEVGFFVRSLRIRALDQWQVSFIVRCLPVILLIALLLFFSGLAILLWNVNRTTAIAASCGIGATVLILLITSILPVINPRCPFRSPQVRTFHYLWHGPIGMFYPFRYSLTKLGHGLSIVLYWCVHLRIPDGDVRRRLMRGLGLCQARWRRAWQCLIHDDWLDLDQKLARRLLVEEDKDDKDDGDTTKNWLWFAQTFGQDAEAMLAFVHCIETRVLTATSPRDVSSLLEQLYLLFYHATQNGAPREPLGSLESIPNETAKDVALALGIAYAAILHPPLVLELLQRRLELHLRIIGSVSARGHKILDTIAGEFYLRTKWTSQVQTALATSPQLEEFGDQIEGIMWQSLTQRESNVEDIGIQVETMLYVFPSKLDERLVAFVPHCAVVSLNRRLEAVLRSPPHSPIRPQSLVGNIAEYIHKMRWNTDSPWRGHDSFPTLACLVDVEMEKYPDLQLRADCYGQQWNWKDFVQELDRPFGSPGDSFINFGSSILPE